jgi:hypothetical protein
MAIDGGTFYLLDGKKRQKVGNFLDNLSEQDQSKNLSTDDSRLVPCPNSS